MKGDVFIICELGMISLLTPCHGTRPQVGLCDFQKKKKNDITVKDKIPVSDINYIINAVASHEFTSKINLTDGYHNVRIEEDSE